MAWPGPEVGTFNYPAGRAAEGAAGILMLSLRAGATEPRTGLACGQVNCPAVAEFQRSGRCFIRGGRGAGACSASGSRGHDPFTAASLAHADDPPPPVLKN